MKFPKRIEVVVERPPNDSPFLMVADGKVEAGEKVAVYQLVEVKIQREKRWLE